MWHTSRASPRADITLGAGDRGRRRTDQHDRMENAVRNEVEQDPRLDVIAEQPCATNHLSRGSRTAACDLAR